MRVIWTASALRDLASARAYVARDSPLAAERLVASIMKAVAGLEHFPERGRPGRRANTRELVVGRTPYVVPYYRRGDRVEILRVLHGRQRWPDSFASLIPRQDF